MPSPEQSLRTPGAAGRTAWVSPRTLIRLFSITRAGVAAELSLSHGAKKGLESLRGHPSFQIFTRLGGGDCETSPFESDTEFSFGKTRRLAANASVCGKDAKPEDFFGVYNCSEPMIKSAAGVGFDWIARFKDLNVYCASGGDTW
jgi:hypothetical protein